MYGPVVTLDHSIIDGNPSWKSADIHIQKDLGRQNLLICLNRCI